MFRPDDLESHLLSTQNDFDGKSDSEFPTIFPRQGANEDFRTVVSMHELGHNDINTHSAYGNALILYGRLSAQQLPEIETYRKILDTLIEYCRIAHEVYATSTGLFFFEDDEQQIVDAILAGSEEYKYYYLLGRELTKGLPTYFLRSLVIGAAINYCFQGRAVAAAILADFKQPRLGRLPREFPNDRLLKLMEHCQSPFFLELASQYAESIKGTADHPLWQLELSGKPQDVNAQDINRIARDFQEFVRTKLDLLFYQDETASFSLYDFYHEFSQPLSQQIRTAYPGIDLLLQVPGEPNMERYMMINMERETIQFAETPQKCYIQYVRELPAELRAELFQEDNLSYLVVTLEYFPLLRNQYQFIDPERVDDLMGIEYPMAFIRVSLDVSGETVLLLIPFPEPEELVQFLEQKPSSLTVLGRISQSVEADDSWRKRWISPFVLHCSVWLYLNDVSLIYVLEQYLGSMTNVSYSILSQTLEERTFKALLFKYTLTEDIDLMMLTPCSDMHAIYAEQYIGSHFPQYKKDSTPIGDDRPAIEILFRDLIEKQREFTLHTALIETEFYTNGCVSGTPAPES